MVKDNKKTLEVRHAIADIVKNEGVDYIFGHTGGHIRQLWDALIQVNIKTIFNKVEGNGVFMAIAHAQQSGKVGVVLGTSGAGVQNMVIAVASAHLDSVPLVVIGAAVPSFIAGRNALQDSSGQGRSVEQRLIFSACTKVSMSVANPKQAPQIFRDAFRIAQSGRPGPVFVEVPSDFWRAKVEYTSLIPDQYRTNQLVAGTQSQVNKIIDELKKAKNPTIIIGEGAVPKYTSPNERIKFIKKMDKFLKTLSIPYSATPLTKDLVDEKSSLYLGAMRTTYTNRLLYKYLKEADFVLSLGNRFDQWEWSWIGSQESVIPKAKIAQIDYDQIEIGRVYPADYSLISDVETFIDMVKPFSHSNTKKLETKVLKLRNESRSAIKLQLNQDKSSANQFSVNPSSMIRIIEQYLPDNGTVVSDTGNLGSITISQLKTSLNQRFFHANRNSPMGYAVPASIGAKIGQTGPVVCLVGDGSFNMTSNELGTLLNYDFPVLFVVADDSSCSSIKSGNLEEFGYTNMTEFINPDYCKLAESYGINSAIANNDEEFENLFKKAINQKNSYLIHVKLGSYDGIIGD